MAANKEKHTLKENCVKTSATSVILDLRGKDVASSRKQAVDYKTLYLNSLAKLSQLEEEKITLTKNIVDLKEKSEPWNFVKRAKNEEVANSVGIKHEYTLEYIPEQSEEYIITEFEGDTEYMDVAPLAEENEIVECNHHVVLENIQEPQSTRQVEDELEGFAWNITTTRCLISLFKKYQTTYDNAAMGNKCKIWDRLAKEMESMGFGIVTGVQCDTKWRRLKTQYARNIKKLRQTGVVKWSLFPAMDEILSTSTFLTKTKIVNPVAVATSIKSFPKRRRVCHGSSHPTSEHAYNSTKPEHFTHEQQAEDDGDFEERIQQCPSWFRVYFEYMKQRDEGRTSRDNRILNCLKELKDIEERKLRIMERHMDKF